MLQLPLALCTKVDDQCDKLHLLQLEPILVLLSIIYLTSAYVPANSSGGASPFVYWTSISFSQGRVCDLLNGDYRADSRRTGCLNVQIRIGIGRSR